MMVQAKKIETNKPSIKPRLKKRTLLSIVLREVVKKNRLKYLVLSQVQKPFSKRRLRMMEKNSQRNPLHVEDVIEIVRIQMLKKEHKSKKSKRPRDQPLLPDQNHATREEEVKHRMIRKRLFKMMQKLKNSEAENDSRNDLHKKRRNFPASMFPTNALVSLRQSIKNTSLQNGVATK